GYILLVIVSLIMHMRIIIWSNRKPFYYFFSKLILGFKIRADLHEYNQDPYLGPAHPSSKGSGDEFIHAFENLSSTFFWSSEDEISNRQTSKNYN
ncbi:hypothetical protein ACJX0J_024895, partial [Zea mays]